MRRESFDDAELIDYRLWKQSGSTKATRKRERLFDGPLSEDDIDLIEDFWAAEARDDLWAYRQYIDPTLVKGWWVAHMSQQFQLFFDKLNRGERPKLMIEAPPQHGKSRGLIDAVSWFQGKRPSLKTIYGSFSDDLGTIANAQLQRIWSDREKFGRVFPDLRMPYDSEGQYSKNSSFIEFPGHRGYFRNVTIGGQINGKTLSLGIVDDPLKGREAAQSKLMRDKAWNWLTDDFFSRFSDDAGFILTMTRWHIDDPAGRWLAKFPETIVLKYPAMFITTPDGWKNDAWDPRLKDEPLFPEYKSREFLLERKSLYTVASWESLYQQMPIISGGGMFPVINWKKSNVRPSDDEIKKTVRYWDKAGTQDGGAWTSGCLMHMLNNGMYFISNIVRGQWSALERETNILKTAKEDAATWGRVEIHLEQEPGSGGKESAERSIAMLAGYPAFADPARGSKEIRAEPYAAQQQAKHVTLYEAAWNQEFIDEHETFPNGKFKDQVDSAAGAFAKCVKKSYRYDASLAWVGGPLE